MREQFVSRKSFFVFEDEEDRYYREGILAAAASMAASIAALVAARGDDAQAATEAGISGQGGRGKARRYG